MCIKGDNRKAQIQKLRAKLLNLGDESWLQRVIFGKHKHAGKRRAKQQLGRCFNNKQVLDITSLPTSPVYTIKSIFR